MTNQQRRQRSWTYQDGGHCHRFRLPPDVNSGDAQAAPGGHDEGMQTALDNVVALLDLEAIEVNIFRGLTPDDNRQRIFGGQVAGQALVAAARTVERGAVHSLHAYFLRAGNPQAPVLYEVDRIRDGRSFTTRRVVAIQHGRAIFQLAASFHTSEEGYEHFEPMPRVPDPETLQSHTRTPDQDPTAGTGRMPALDLRYITTRPPDRSGPLPPTQRLWMRANGTLGDNPLLHTCLLTYASDLTLLDSTLAPHGTSAADPQIMLASLDHAMWFHAPFRADEWLLYDQHTPAASGARGLATGRVFTRDGQLAASVVQEGLIRRII